nr:beta-glucosidase 11-like isoform X2 [Tanacetum cinerariifolium]
CTRGDSTSELYIATHNLLLVHASAVKLYLEKDKAMHHGFVGINLFAYWFEPYTNTIEDVKAAQRANDFYLANISTITPTQFDVDPLAFQKLLKYLKEEYGNPHIYIHEIGQVQPRNGTLMDTPRVEYLHAYIGALLESLRSLGLTSLDNGRLSNWFPIG